MNREQIAMIVGIIFGIFLTMILEGPEIINKKPQCNSPGHLSRPGTPNPMTNNTEG